MALNWLNRPHIRICLSVLAFIVVAALGILAISWQTSQGLRRDTRASLQQSVRLVDMTLDNAAIASGAVEHLIGQPCDPTTLQALRWQVARVPNIRTVNLYRQHTIYCTSLFGPRSDNISNDRYTGGQLMLMSGNSVTPDHPLIAYRHDVNDSGILIGVDGYFLHNILRLLSTHAYLILQVGDQWMDSQGKIHQGTDWPDGERMALTSQRYPYEVRLVIRKSDHWNYIFDYASLSLVLFPLVSIFIAFMTYILLGRFGNPTSALKAALEKKQFIPYLQPVVDGTTHEITGAEVLMRWQHPQSGLIPPYQFIPLAEESGLIVPMTRSIMAQVREQFGPIAAQLPKNFHFGFNICAGHFKDLTLAEDCKAFIDAFRENPINLVLELTERELIEPGEVTHSLFRALRRMGVLIAMDDFGTGHSSLAYLQKFHIDILKIDQSFIGRIGTDALAGHIVDNVIDLAKRLQMIIVAEGIETQTQVNYLAPYRLEFLQGYFFGKPVAPDDFIDKWLT
ncbi:EAL domain-containing protein (putative c-di-GMP-specific phosphodiesterase class I) [Rahnella sp. BIGb0236]|nr:diguanylate phosphodiesterase [Rahnella victoriana]TDS90225.1 EAL domain-containing protein (putative c-di-GMP-specific phosphodiesterase class I) [Rahnella sp. BIGb0236]